MYFHFHPPFYKRHLIFTQSLSMAFMATPSPSPYDLPSLPVHHCSSRCCILHRCRYRAALAVPILPALAEAAGTHHGDGDAGSFRGLGEAAAVAATERLGKEEGQAMNRTVVAAPGYCTVRCWEGEVVVGRER